MKTRKIINIILSIVLFTSVFSATPVNAATSVSVSAQLCNANGSPDALTRSIEIPLNIKNSIKFRSIPIPIYEEETGKILGYEYTGIEASAFEFHTTSNNSFYEIIYSNPLFSRNVNFTLYDSNYNITSFSDAHVSLNQSEIKKEYFKLKPNSTYYIVADVNNGENYAPTDVYITVNEKKDDVGDNFNNASNYNSDTASYFIDGFSDVDMFKLTTSSNKSFYKFDLTNVNLNNMTVAIYNKNYQIIYKTDCLAGELKSNFLDLASSELYYIEIKSMNEYDMGQYLINVTEIKDDVGDDINHSLSVNFNKSYSFVNQCNLDVDLFTFNIGNHSSVNVKVKNNSNPNVTLKCELQLSESNVIVSSNTIGQNAAIVEANNLIPNSNYYLSISSDDLANYEFIITYPMQDIVYHLNGGINNTLNPAKYIKYELTKLHNPTRSGYNFKGWYKTPECDGEMIDVINSSETEILELYAKWEKINLPTIPAANSVKLSVKNLKVINIKNKKIKITFAKSPNVSGYYIQYSLYKNFKKSKKIYTKSNSKIIKGLKKKKTYYVRVRCYKKINGKTFNSPFKSKAIKIKK